MSFSEDPDIFAGFPRVFAETWCGEHSPVITEKPSDPRRDWVDIPETRPVNPPEGRVAAALEYLREWEMCVVGMSPSHRDWFQTFSTELRRRLTS